MSGRPRDVSDSVDRRQSRTLVELLAWRARTAATARGYTFLKDGDAEHASLTYAELDAAARRGAAQLRQRVPPGARALLLCETGPEFVTGFFACLYAGVVVVPVAPPKPKRSTARLEAMTVDSGAVALIATNQVLARLSKDLPTSLTGLQRLVLDESAPPGDVADPDDANRHTLACLQYTSGSTATPKGVMLSHRNLVHNAALIERVLQHEAHDAFVSWLPLFHDMGLMFGVVAPVFAGLPVVLMSPVAFLQRPVRWLRAISRYRATISGGPDFAYDLCVRRIAARERASLDLRSWTVAFNGAEPVRPSTLDAFSRTFAECGFQRTAFYPCYGLAEATLAVSGGLKHAAPVLRASDSRTLVGCGRSMPGQRIRIVNPESCTECEAGRIGEVWVAGPSVARGYWRRPDATAHTFAARLMPTGSGPWLRTGDLGLLDERQELFIVGRLSDVVIVNGRNHHPQDIELTVERSHPSLLARGGAAFAISCGELDRLIVVHEVDLASVMDTGSVIGTVRRAVAEEHEIPVADVVLVKPGAIPRTSSGKVQRRFCRDRFLAGTLDLAAPAAREYR